MRVPLPLAYVGQDSFRHTTDLFVVGANVEVRSSSCGTCVVHFKDVIISCGMKYRFEVLKRCVSPISDHLAS